MTFTERMVPHLRPLAEQLLRNEDYRSLKMVAEFLLWAKDWQRHSDAKRLIMLEEMMMVFHHPEVMGNSEHGSQEHYRDIASIVDAECRVVANRSQ